MKVKIVQLIVDKDIQSNKEKILKALGEAEEDEWVIFPEAVLSGYYPQEILYTALLNWESISKFLNEIKKLVTSKRCHCILGSATKIEGIWRNTVLVLSYGEDEALHHKIQLSKLDKKHFKSGEVLKAYQMGDIKYGLQACRELLFPGQWSALKKEGVQIVFHLNNAVQPHDALWKHILITRAIENSIFVVSVNNAESPQKLASYVISPSGQILAETATQEEQAITVELDLEQVISNLVERQDY